MKRLTLGIVCCIMSVCLFTTISVAQQSVENQMGGEGQVPSIFSNPNGLGGALKSGIQIMSGEPGLGMGFRGNAMGGGFEMPAPDPYSLLGNPSVQKDIELVGKQLKQVQELQAAFQKQMHDQIGDFGSGSLNPGRMMDIGEVVEKLRAEQRTQIENLLLPHQIERLQEVALQTFIQQSGASNVLASSAVAQALEISAEQKAELKTRAKEINEQLAKDIAELRRKAKENLIKEVLTPEQQLELKKMVGDKYEPRNEDWDQYLNKGMPAQKPLPARGKN